jgi:hypothetical protein
VAGPRIGVLGCSRDDRSPQPSVTYTDTELRGFDKRISSTLRGLAGLRKLPPLLMNPQDAAQRSLAHGIDVELTRFCGHLST